MIRTSSGRAGSDRREATAMASARAWSNPRLARRADDRGTHVTTSASKVFTAAMAAPHASATTRHPPNFSR